MEKTIYIVLTNTGTLFSKAIGAYTRRELNHASIAFDEQLNEMYSFGRKQRNNPFLGGFIKEEAAEGLFKRATCAIYKYHVTSIEYNRMRHKIRQMEQQKELYKYNLIGLFGLAMNIEIEREHAFFCSQFVATIISECHSSELSHPPCFMQPHHFEQLSSLDIMYRGELQTYVNNRRPQEEQIQDPSWKRRAFQLLA